MWSEIAPTWKNFKAATYDRCLGFVVAPGACSRGWDALEEPILKVAQVVDHLAPQEIYAILLFQVLGVSKLVFVGLLQALEIVLKNSRARCTS